MQSSYPEFIVLTLLSAAFLIASPVLAQPADDSPCQPQCAVSINVPEQGSKRPEVDTPRIVAAPGANIAFTTNKKVTIVFPEDTPFNDGGQAVYTFTVSASTPSQQKVRTDNTVCVTEPGCKYIVIDRSYRGRRPPLDPYVIIGR